MGWLNYHHLLYFWTAAREGGVTRAAEVLRLAQPTLSTQIRALERSLGHKLFTRAGRGLALTDAGRRVFRYADEIFGLGRDLVRDLTGEAARPQRLVVGISDALPKLMVKRLLAPALLAEDPIRLICLEDRTERLLAELALHRLDLVFADEPPPPQVAVRCFAHLLGECGVLFFGTASLRAQHRGDFPDFLGKAPVLLPAEGTALRRGLDQWLAAKNLVPRIAGEFSDSALMKTFGQSGAGFFAGPFAIARQIERQYQVKRVGEAKGVRERLYAISLERRLKHPAVVAVSQAARQHVFA